ncbi:MAG: cysteine--tRNA ligase [Campylobacterota bacterium]|nr:cysteine--tRNA ligase [Campylobacterota bacterium]
MYIYDSVKKEKLKFESIVPNEVKLYVCGPTVYDNAHLGHAKSALVFDLLKRVLEANGYSVTYARNITDIDDKIINKSIELGVTISELTSKYIDLYHEEMGQLGVLKPDIEPRATESIEAMTYLIEKLIQNNHAYVSEDGDVYFDTQSDSKYLSISSNHQDSDDTQSRVESSTCKRNQSDFALWKATKDETISFDSKYSKGRPGWHLECSAMIEKHLSTPNSTYSIDIHGGGADLLFPHHENEAAQSRCATNHELSKYWMHNGFVNIDGMKMSKSLGNSFFLKDALKSYSGEVLRYYLLSTHYRADFNFNEEDLIASKKRLDKIYRLKKRVFGMSNPEIKTTFMEKLLESLSNDLNISESLALIDEMISDLNEKLDSNAKDKVAKKEILSNLAYIETILGFGADNPYEYFQYGVDEDVKNSINTLIIERANAKKEKDFETSDKIRDKILRLGVNIMDTPQGTFWEKIEG